MSLLSRFSRDRTDCRAVARRLQSYLDGELDERRRAAIAAHLDACRDCGLEAEAYLEIKGALGRTRRPVDPSAIDRLRRFGESLTEPGPH
ncbi:MAG: zf-HC2 domain-containing protein [Actinomycetota bacterium]